MKRVITVCMIVFVLAAESAGQIAGSGASAPGRQGGMVQRARTGVWGGCCGCRKYWDAYPRPELNPPEDTETLPDREQQKFVKMFRLVPDQVKVKSTQNYTGRMTFMKSPQYAAITDKLTAKLARSGKMLAADPAVTAEDVLKMCRDTIVYGRSLIMGRMEPDSFAALARRYHFKNAAKTIEDLEDSKNFRRGVVVGYPHDDPECRDFETLAKTANPAQWQSFLARVETLQAKRRDGNGRGMGGASAAVTKQQLYDRYVVTSRRELPEDFATLPNRDRVRHAKIYDYLPVQVLSMAGQEYRQRRTYLEGPAYAEVKRELSACLAKETRRLSSDPAVTPAEVVATCDELLKYGRPLACGDLRHVSLVDLARTYHFRNVEKFVEAVEDSKNAKRGIATPYPDREQEYVDFAALARRVYPDRWSAFLSRLSDLNKAYRRLHGGERM